MSENKTGKYLKYAIGEIVLVVIGILIALQINNYNERKKEEQILDGVYSIIVEDLKSDIDQLSEVLRRKEYFEPYFKKVMNGEMTIEDYEECPSCIYMAFSFRTLSVEKRGYTLLEQFDNSSRLKNDSLSMKIIYFYSNQLIRLHTGDILMENLANSTLESWNKYDWFPDWVSGNYEEFINYSLTSQEYANMASQYYFLHYSATYSKLKTFIEEANALIQLIEERLRNTK